MKFCSFLFKMNLGKYCSIGTTARTIIFVSLLANTNLNIISSEKKVIEEPKPLNRPYETLVDYAMYINNMQEPKDGAIAVELFSAIRACSGVTLKKDPKPEEMFQYKQFVVIATMPVVSSLLSHEDPITKLSDWNDLLKHINTYIDAYTTDDQSFVVFIPKNYKDGEFKKDGTKIKFSNKEEQLKYIGFNPQAIKPFRISEIKPQEEPYQFLPNKAQEINVKKLGSIFIPDESKIARCIFLEGHGSFNNSIAGMNKETYLEFLELLEKLDTRFLYITSCYSGGINTVVMNMRLKEDFRDTLDLKQKKSFDILNIHFPIVVEATSDTVALGRELSLTDEKIFFMNNFFTTLHAFLNSPTWEMDRRKSEWRIKHGLALKPTDEYIYKSSQNLFKMADSWALQAKKLMASKDQINIDKGKRLLNSSLILKKMAEKNIQQLMVEGPLVLMSDVLKQIYFGVPLMVNLPSIYIPDCKEIPGGIFFEAVKVDNMNIITNKNLATNVIIADREKKRIISEAGEIKEHGLTEEEKTKQTKYVLIYPVDMSNTTFTITCKEPPQFISKIGGNAYHIINTFKYENRTIEDIVRCFIYPWFPNFKDFMMGSFHKAWLIWHLPASTTESVEFVVFYKPASSIDDELTKFDSIVMYSYKNKYYMQKINYAHTQDYPYTKFSFGSEELISAGYYTLYLKAILKNCSPDPLALEKFTSSKETPETIKTAADNFLNSAAPSKKITLDDIKEAQKILSMSDSLAISRQATFEMFSEAGKQSKQLLDQAISSMQLKDNNTLLHLAIQNGVDKDILKHLITDKSIVAQNNEGLPPLHYAIKIGASKDIITLLINDKSIVEKDKNLGLPPLHYAIGLNNEEIVDLLVKTDDKCLVIPNKDKESPLIYAIIENKAKDIIEPLITEETINMKFQDITPLQLAIESGAAQDIIDLLKKHGGK